jgi:type-F conjugative transfer system pilin assembly protein TrbC
MVTHVLAAWRAAGVLLVGVGLGLAPAPSDAAADAARRAAEATAQAGRAVADQTLGAMGVGSGGGRRWTAGVYVVATWGMDDEELQALMADARRVGYPVVVRGVWRGSMPETSARLKRLAGERGERAPAMTIDPPLIRWLGVDAAPALVLRGATRGCVVAGRRPLRELIMRAAREWPAFEPWAEAARRALTARAEEPGTLAGLRWPGEPPACRITLDPPPLALAEPDLSEVLRAAVLAHDWRGDLARTRERTAAKLREGPGLALPRATRVERRVIDPTVEVHERVVEPRTRQVLAEPGRRINPLSARPWRGAWLVIDATDPAQVTWAETRLATEPVDAILVARGDAVALMRRWRRPVHWLPPELVDRLGVSAVPAVVRGRGEQLEVETDVVGDVGQFERAAR